MAPSLLIGTLDVSRYLDVQQGQGMDPAAASFSDRVFSHSLLKQGGVLALENVKLKELIFPLLMHAANTPALSALVQQINQALAVAGQTATWTDDGAAQSTVFDLASGQLDIEYDYRRAQQSWLHAKLRLFAQPFGHTAAPRSLPVGATAGLGPVAQIMVSTQILGDAPAALQGIVPGMGYTALSVLPDANYPAIQAVGTSLPGATGYGLTGATVQGASGAVASQFVRTLPGASPGAQLPGANFALSATQAYPGDHRVLGIVRTAGTSSLWVSDPRNNSLPTVTVSATDWTMVDLGVMRVPTDVGAVASLAGVAWANRLQINGGTQQWDITALVILPETQTVYLVGPAQANSSRLQGVTVFDGITTDSYGYTRLTSPVAVTPYSMGGQVRGAYPQLSPSPFTASQPGVIAGLAFAAPAAGQIPGALSALVLERTRYVF